MLYDMPLLADGSLDWKDPAKLPQCSNSSQGQVSSVMYADCAYCSCAIQAMTASSYCHSSYCTQIRLDSSSSQHSACCLNGQSLAFGENDFVLKADEFYSHMSPPFGASIASRKAIHARLGCSPSSTNQRSSTPLSKNIDCHPHISSKLRTQRS